MSACNQDFIEAYGPDLASSEPMSGGGQGLVLSLEQDESHRDVDGQAPHDSRKRVVMFDVENVLYDASHWYRWLAQVFTRLEAREQHESFLLHWRHTSLPQVYTGRKPFGVAFADSLQQIGFARRQIEELVAAERAQSRRAKLEMRILPGVRSTLHRLIANGISLAILTNSNQSSEALRIELERLGLSGVFSIILTSVDLRCCLPDPCCFASAIASIRLAPHEIIFVGHEIDELRGARQAGMTALAFNTQAVPDDIPWIERIEEIVDFANSRPSLAAMASAV